MAQDERQNQEKEPMENNLKWDWSDLRRKADWWAVWLGLCIIIAGMAVYFPYKSKMELKIKNAEEKWQKEATRTDKIKTIAWYRLNDAKQKVQAMKEVEGKAITKFTSKPHSWKNNPLDAFVKSREKAAAGNDKAKEKLAAIAENEKAAYENAVIAEKRAEDALFNNRQLNSEATAAITNWRNWYKKKSAAAKKAKTSGHNQIPYLIGFMIFLTLFLSIGIGSMGKSVLRFIKSFWFVFLLAVLAYLLAQQSWMKTHGIGYAAWAIVIGLFISNVLKVPKWAKPAVQSEYYIKIGLVLLGAKILFTKLVAIGIPGIFVAWVVTPIVLLTTFWFGQRVVKMASKTLNITIAADMSVCGVSAAIATAAACKAKKEELTLAIGLSISFTAIMMVVMPVLIKLIFPAHMVEVLGGAWVQ
jgi:hypothetical protein